MAKPSKDHQQVDHFLASHGRRDILRLGGAQGHTILSLGLPQDRSVVETQHVSRHRLSRVQVGCVVRVHPTEESVQQRQTWITVRESVLVRAA
eukprot:2127017-Rhodomonas_salina.1